MLVDLQRLHAQSFRSTEERGNPGFSPGEQSFTKLGPYPGTLQHTNHSEACPRKLKLQLPKTKHPPERSYGISHSTNPGPQPRSIDRTTPNLLRPPSINKTPIAPNPERISAQEAQERRTKGLCFYCDEKFTPGHRCQQHQLFMIEEPATTEEVMDILDPMTQENIPKISLQAMIGANCLQTF
ncbi:hypothetical protein FEM48_Zijuj07G0142000 [Ziziphus jujuba var. spinosa]|uniref:Uncharacterized protein n=1 Tax=Ziziphus jujuba var. spinosa TaxID=714518 RepID=A0A978V536_ZIZJJ|nr:hypothetical protein FEM48_Zijuj07G0142000 [Ziziphus jujuba var. spinosa]